MGRRGSGVKAGERLRAVLAKSYPLLNRISETESSQRPQPDKWSAKEIIGHLTDSAVINHQRFVKATQHDHLVLEGYQQDVWVSVQQYQARSWKDILTLWEKLNHHIALLVEHIPSHFMDRSVPKHNLDEILLNPIPRNQPASLRLLIDDYIDHMVHHIRQILKDFEE